MSDIQNRAFITAGDFSVAGTALFFVDSQFKNLKNVQIDTSLTQVTIQNTSFENLEIDTVFLVLAPRSIGETSLRMFNTSLV